MKNLKQIRTAAGMSITTLAHTTGITRQSIHRYESGEAEPVLSNAVSIADALNVDLDLLTDRAVIHETEDVRIRSRAISLTTATIK